MPHGTDNSSPKMEFLAAVQCGDARTFHNSTTSVPGEGVEMTPGLLCTRDLQRGLLDQKLQNMQHDTNMVQEELREANSRIAQMTVKLNEHKAEFSALTHRYGATMEKLTSAEGNVKRLEEHLVHERKQHCAVREERDELKGTLRETQREVEKLRRELQQERERPTIDQREVQRMLDDRTRYIPTAEVQQRIEEVRATQKAFANRLVDSFSALLLAQDEEENAFSLTRSSVTAVASELQAKVVSAEATLNTLQEQLLAFSGGVERGVVEMTTALIVENKELWQNLAKIKGAHDATLAQLTSLQRKEEFVPREQYESMRNQNAATTEKLKKLQESYETQARYVKEQEERVKVLKSSNDQLQNQIQSLSNKLAIETEELERRGCRLEESKASLRDAARRNEELQELMNVERQQANQKISQLNEDYASMKKDYEERISHWQQKQDVARNHAEEARRELGDMQERFKRLRQELEERNSAFEQYKHSIKEEQKINCSIKEEALNEKELLERELNITRRKLDDQIALFGEVERERDSERSEHRVTRATAAKLEMELASQRHAFEQLQLGTDRLRVLGQDLERQLDDQRAKYQCELAALQERKQELEKNCKALQDELTSVRSQLSESVSHGAAEGCGEKGEANTELQQLQERYQEVQQENVILRDKLEFMQGKLDGMQRLTQQLDDVQERLRQLPSLRQVAEDARNDAVRAAEETQALRRERDAMAVKLDCFLGEGKQAVLRNEEWLRLLHSAAEQGLKLEGQRGAVKSPKPRKQQHSAIHCHATHAGGYSDIHGYQQRIQNPCSGKHQPAVSPSCSVVPSTAHLNSTSLYRPWR
ncbi:hypothetical protein TRVL_02484 [Trypanosoma vivax]|uniref:Uncharacterized protein n=1 Tax=Trypanosoma vivax (strain Y486) TaxID=1055687 RepID=G0U433_TRYVY|nr:hypothetical protein TRVL_02484 [Trypanosoma vivax]CCC52195.1 conserved hypothetical protein [Trypanosoma vivax Y486]